MPLVNARVTGHADAEARRSVSVKEIAIYCDFKHDESYTPSKISIRAGTHFHDLQEVKEVTLDEPTGWLSVRTSKS
ncbi:anaphase-promoting complex, subunit 10-domain-containing protein [Baffinella frigidus]|nr:anaphase-promoting complex, subunit 10-domain-containing protein [Cryptophyta sp. CCMP2293]